MSRKKKEFALVGILPNKGGDTGPVSAIIHGSGFVEGATVKLVKAGQPDIVGDPVSVAENGQTITTTFDLTGKARGPWDVVVTNPDGTSATLPKGFTIEEGRAPQVWVDIVGRSVIRPNRPQTFTILFGNRGNVDALILPVVRGVPPDTIWQIEWPPPPVIDGTTIRWETLNYAVTEEESGIYLPITRVPPGQTVMVKLRLTFPTAGDFEITVVWAE